MKEAQIRKRAIEILENEGWVCWYPSRSHRWAKNKDIFNAYDVIAGKKGKILLIQLTSLVNITTREKKVKAFLKKNDLSFYSEVWGYDKKNKKFKIIRIYGA